MLIWPSLFTSTLKYGVWLRADGVGEGSNEACCCWDWLRSFKANVTGIASATKTSIATPAVRLKERRATSIFSDPFIETRINANRKANFREHLYLVYRMTVDAWMSSLVVLKLSFQES